MQTRDFTRTLRRRWYLVLATVFLAIGATVFVVIRMGPTYEATGSALILPPLTTVERNAEVQAVGNPLLSLGGVSQARDLVIQQLMSQSAQDDIAATYPGAEYQVTQDFTNSAPVILVTMEATSPEAASEALQALIARVPVALASLQSKFQLPADASITSTPLIVDTQPQVLHKDQVRTGIVVAIAVLGVGLLAIGLLDGLLLGRPGRPDQDDDREFVPRPRMAGVVNQIAVAPEGVRRLGPRTAVAPSSRQLGQRPAPTDSTAVSRRFRPVSPEGENEQPDSSQHTG